MPLKYTRSRAPSAQEEGLGDAPVISNETLRRKARYRLIGSVVLVLLGILAFTLMLDTQPRPNTADVSVLIPSRDKFPNLASAQASSAAQVSSVTAHEAASSAAVASTVVPVQTTAKSAVTPAKPSPTVPVMSSLAPQEVIVDQPSAAKVAAARATEESQQSDKSSAQEKKAKADPDEGFEKGRFILQVGAFAEVQKAREVRVKLEHAGIKTYTQVIQNDEGRRIRVRVGPFDKRADAEKMATKIRTLDLPAALLTL
jgi:DedD protein